MEKRKPPFIRPPEFSDQTLVDQHAPAVESEQRVFEILTNREEMLDIFDSLREEITYESLFGPTETDKDRSARAELLKDVPNTLRETLFAHFQEAVRSSNDIQRTAHSTTSPEHPILFEDLVSILKYNPQKVRECMILGVSEHEHRQMDHDLSRESKSDRQMLIRRAAEARIAGRSFRLDVLFRHRFLPLAHEMSALSDDDQKKLEAYSRANKPKVKKTIRDLRDVDFVADVAQTSRRFDVLRSTAQTADTWGVTEEDVREGNAEFEKLLKTITGIDMATGGVEIAQTLDSRTAIEFTPAYVNMHREMRNLYRMLHGGKIVETPYIQELITRAETILRKGSKDVAPGIVYFHGDTGTGKTALAVHMARTLYHTEPIILAGNKFLEPDRFTEDFRLSQLSSAEQFNRMAESMGLSERFTEGSPAAEVMTALVGGRQKIREIMTQGAKEKKYRAQCAHEQKVFDSEEFEAHTKTQQLTAEEMSDIEKQISVLFDNPVQGRYVLGALYESRKSGRPLIIDEANAISPEVMIALNEEFQRRVGETQEARSGSFTINEAPIFMTGNTGSRYTQGRFTEIDPAMYSRIYPIEVRYLPQSMHLSGSAETILERLRVDTLSERSFADRETALLAVKSSQEQAGCDEIFKVLMFKILNRRLGAELLVKKNDRYSTIKDIYKLSVAARAIMNIFEGNFDQMPNLPQLDTVLGTTNWEDRAEKLKVANLTMRDLIDGIVGRFVQEGGRMDIEYYVWDFVQKYAQFPEEQAIVYCLLQEAGLFSVAEGWPQFAKYHSMELFKNGGDVVRSGGQTEHIDGLRQFDPIKNVSKYQGVRMRRGHVSMMAHNADYEMSYFPSPEMMQIISGFLPPRDVSEYETLQKEEIKLTQGDELHKQREYWIDEIVSTQKGFSKAFLRNSQNADRILAIYKNNKIQQLDFCEKASDAEFHAELNTLFDSIITFCRDLEALTQEQVDAVADGSLEGKVGLVQAALSKLMKDS